MPEIPGMTLSWCVRPGRQRARMAWRSPRCARWSLGGQDR
jgi:hypothetical protein